MKLLNEERNYRYLFLSALTNGIGARFSQVGVYALIYLLTESGLILGSLMAVRILPTIIFAPISGMLADRYDKARILYYTDLLRTPFAILPLFAMTSDSIWLLYISSFVLAVGEAIYQPARYSFIPDIVKRKNLLAVNGLEQNVIGLTLVIGSLLGGVISFLTSVYVLFVIHAICLGVAALFVKRLIGIQVKQSDTDRGHVAFRETGMLILQVPLLRVFLMVMLLMPIANGVDNVIFNLIALDVFEQGDLGVGLIYASLGAGLMLSSVVMKRLKGSFILLGVLMIMFEGGGHLVLSQSQSFWQALIFATIIAMTAGVSNICFDTVLMKVLPAGKRGTLFGTLSMVQNGSMGLSMVGAGFLLEWFSPLHASVIVGSTYIGFALLFFIAFKMVNFRWSVRRLRKESVAG
ncbi:MFS transporter [Jeotgalibacillus terrae]|uniref:MFS transporter n=1 Tax=Jeotgalibacillus terrae TaxID=587735 RepID=A0ABW5ZI68_9BACL|nr:MFS transporter [Jeotgalibacillus terrae]MBM7578635.1 MFS family permease [Jeotgalibacillus terrae]